jgi:hypothetical protein
MTPNGDGTGPFGQGPTGKGMGPCGGGQRRGMGGGQGRGMGQRAAQSANGTPNR